MISRLILAFTLFASTNLGLAQDLEYENIEWEKSPTWEEIDSSYAKEQEIVLKYNRLIEFAYSEKYGNNLVEYSTVHKKIRVLGDDAIEKNNKVYISMRSAVELTEAKARVITPDNKTIELDESNINEVQTEDGLTLKYFAIDGIELNSDIEYTYTVLKVPSYNGNRIRFQSDIYKEDVTFTLISPNNLRFKLKSYNGFPEVVQDSLNEEKNVYSASVDKIDILNREEYCAYDKEVQQVVYKLHSNVYSGKSNITSFGKISQNLYNYYYTEIGKPSKKKLKGFIKESGAFDATTEEEKIRVFENHLKGSIGIIDGVETKVIKDILADGYTSRDGLTYMFIQGLKIMDIKHELVLTCDNDRENFDEDFEHYQVLNNEMLYFPNIKKYTAPSDIIYRLGIMPSEWTNQEGLFIKEVAMGDIYTGLGKVKFIKPLTHEDTQDNLELTLDFSDLTKPKVAFKKVLTGYSSIYFQTIYNLLEDEVKKELDKDLITYIDENGEIIDYKVSGIEKEDFVVNPMVYEGTMEVPSVLEKAGNRYLFKIGQLIGIQNEMYEEEETRKLDISRSYNVSYHRQITFTIPDGFELNGLEALEISELYPASEPLAVFESSYVQNGQEITVTIKENYKTMDFKKEEIDEFRRIINAAANFNKVVLFLTKK